MSSPAAVTTALLARRGGRRGLQTHLLSIIAAATGAALLLLLAGLWAGSGARAGRTNWQTPNASSTGNVLQVRSVTTIDGEPVVVVDLARLDGARSVPVPPGLHAFPTAGQVYVSPALLALLQHSSSKHLVERFGTRVTGEIGSSGLAAPDQLLVVVGHRATDPIVAGARSGSDEGTAVTAEARVSSFDGTKADALTEADRSAVVLAIGLILVPIVVLAAAAGRLGASRREQRLAALRLAGGTPRQILAIAGYESLAVGGLGAACGAALYAATLPLLAHFRLGIGDWYASDLWVGLPILLAVVVGVAVLTAVSAVSILSRVVRDPLGVARRDKPGRARAIRILAALVLVGYIVLTVKKGGLRPPQIAALTILLYGSFWLAGPWVVARLGALTSRLARRPTMLMAGRRLLDDPHGAWRAVCGLVLAGFVSGFVSIAQLNVALGDTGDQIVVPVSSPGVSLHAAAERTRAALDTAGSGAVSIHVATDNDSIAMGDTGLIVTVPGGQAKVDAAVTALTELHVGARPFTAADVDAGDTVAFAEFSTAALASLVVGFVIAMVSTALSGIADVLDRRETYRLLRRAGAPMSLVNRARSIEAALPLVVLAGGTTACGIYAADRVNHLTGATVDPTRIIALASCVIVGVGAIMVSLASSRRLLGRVTREGTEQQE